MIKEVVGQFTPPFFFEATGGDEHPLLVIYILYKKQTYLKCLYQSGRRRLRMPFPPWRRLLSNLTILPCGGQCGENLTLLWLASMCPFGSSFLKTTLGISDVVFRLLPAGCSRGISSFPFLFNIEKTKKKSWRVCGGSCRRPNSIGQSLWRPMSMTQSD